MRLRPTVLFDANVFFGARLRSITLFLAETDLFLARWTEKINDEWIRNIHRKQAIPLERLERLRALVNRSVPDCLVTDFETLEASFNLPDPDDRHVLAAALKARADMIVTFNIKDFPDLLLDSLGLQVKHPDEFLLEMFDSPPAIFARAVQRDFYHYKAPPFSFDQYVAALHRAGVANAAKRIRGLRTLIDGPDIT